MYNQRQGARQEEDRISVFEEPPRRPPGIVCSPMVELEIRLEESERKCRHVELSRAEAEARANFFSYTCRTQVDEIHKLEETNKLMLASIKKRSSNEDALYRQLAKKDEEIAAKDAEIAAKEAELGRQIAAIREAFVEVGRCPACWEHMEAPQVTGKL
ncbi:unnamed protein product [Caenorhabditis brenneri]